MILNAGMYFAVEITTRTTEGSIGEMSCPEHSQIDKKTKNNWTISYLCHN